MSGQSTADRMTVTTSAVPSAPLDAKVVVQSRVAARCTVSRGDLPHARAHCVLAVPEPDLCHVPLLLCSVRTTIVAFSGGGKRERSERGAVRLQRPVGRLESTDLS